jgi:SAM-dependent methyltransferase
MRPAKPKKEAQVNGDLVEYYSKRASEYEAIYGRQDPIRLSELRAISHAIMENFRGRCVLEVACGTGYWTQLAAKVAERIEAIDESFEMLEIARAKNIPADKVGFAQADAYNLDTVAGTFDAGLSNFWFSHIPKAQVNEFLHGFHKKLLTRATVFMADNVYVPDIGGELIRRTEIEDTFKIRELSTGSKHVVLKNYYDEEELQGIFAPLVIDLEIHVGQCFWWLSYKIP